MNRYSDLDAPRVSAVLGPTNTGKTHFALARMLAHGSGMMGFPLRLLARENYDRAVKEKGAHQVALITGEEKIVPPRARYFFCTVESMPVDRIVDFLCVDEIQVAADPERGHIFTERLLSARGSHESLFLGSDTVRSLVRNLVPGIQVETRPRLSRLTHAGASKVHRLKQRSAVVAFSAADVYALAELVRRHRGGAAVVLGALSPRTRNAQVAMYQAGEVDHLIATDAIGMGLNMDVRHVAFAQHRKFDGRKRRELTAAEIAQIAGRAGRHTNDGTFGTTADAPMFTEEMVARIEAHEFDAVRHVYWRNPNLRFQSLDALAASLRVSPEHAGLRRVREADDERALVALSQDIRVQSLADSPERIRLLWRICQIPDFRKMMDDGHSALLLRLFLMLLGADPDTPNNAPGRLSADWVAGQVERIDRTDGDIHTLSARIAAIRTWTYIAHHADWLDDVEHWRERTRAIEDRLSDALHDRLRLSFVDKRTAALLGGLNEPRDLIASVRRDGVVLVEGHPVGTLEGLRFSLAETDDVAARRAVRSAADRILGETLTDIANHIAAAADGDFTLSDRLEIVWEENAIARLTPGSDPLKPHAAVIAEAAITPEAKAAVETRLAAWLDGQIRTALAPLFAETDGLAGPARGIHFQVREGLGDVRRRDVVELIDDLSRDDRRALRRTGLTIGRESVYAERLLKPDARRWRAILRALARDERDIGPLPDPGRSSFDTEGWDTARLEALGFRVLAGRAVRLDILERLADLAWEVSKKGPFQPTPPMATLLGTGGGATADVLTGLGYRKTDAPTPPAAADTVSETSSAAVPEGASEEPALNDEPAKTAASETAPAQRQIETEAIVDAPWLRRGGPGKAGAGKGAKAPKGPKGGRTNKRGQPPNRTPNRAPKEKAPDPDSPFAALAALKLKR